MSGLTMIEKNLVDEFTDMSSGYVLDFTNATFSEFFRTEVGIDIEDAAYDNGSNSKGKRLRAFLDRGQPKAIAKALTALWEYREDIRRRDRQNETVLDARTRLSTIIERLGGAALPPSFDEITPINQTAAPITTPNTPSTVLLDDLRRQFEEMHKMDSQERGYEFEKFLNKAFDAWGLDARGGFRNAGEQIDGSFWHNNMTYLLEAKWHQEPTNATPLHAFQGKVGERQFAKGLFVSYAGYSKGALEAFTAKTIVLMDGADIHYALLHRIALGDVINRKERHAAERKNPMAHVHDLFAND